MTGPVEQLEELTAYLDGELDAGARRRVDALLERDPAARALLEELRQTSRLVGALPRAAAPGDLAAAVTARIERRELLGDGGEPWTATPRRAVRWGRSLSAAAAIALVCTAGWLGWQRSSRVATISERLARTDKPERLVARGTSPKDAPLRQDRDRSETIVARSAETEADGLPDAAKPAPAVAKNAVPSVAMARTADRSPANAEGPPVPGEAHPLEDEADHATRVASARRLRAAATPVKIDNRIEIVSESYETRTALARAIRHYADTRGRAVRLREADRTAGAAGAFAPARRHDSEESGRGKTVLVVDLPRSQADGLLHVMNSAASEAAGDIRVVANGREIESITEAGPWIMGGRPPVQVASHEPKMATSRAVRDGRAALSARRKLQARAPGPPKRTSTSRAVVAAEADEGPTRLSAGDTALKAGQDVITLAIVLRSPPSALQRPSPSRKTSPASRPTATPASGPAGHTPPPAGQDGSRG